MRESSRSSLALERSLAWLAGVLAVISCGTASFAREEHDVAARPNILWITAEDMSANLGCYGDRFATTPHLDEFARKSVRYTHAFATAPVCSPVRSCLITGVYATSLGTQRLRSEFPLPAAFKGFPAYLRKAGYFTSNNVKTDYNIRDEKAFIQESWDRNGPRAHWRQRRNGQPFFSVFNLMTTHQSRTSVWPFAQFEKEVGRRLAAAERHDPDEVPVPPYYPRIASVRRTLARYCDCVTAMDKEVGRLLRELEADGLTGDTIVFFYSDHGMGLPRGKRVLHDTGMHVPLIIRFPERYRRHAPAKPGETTERLVSFVDFAPTVLSLAGMPIPDYMQGRAFLGDEAAASRRFVYGARDRVDEVFELSRSVRGPRYLYIRNYMPHLSWMPPERYSDNALMRRDMKRLQSEGKLNALQLTYAAPTKPVEELYDTPNDPHQLRNLAGSTEQREVLERFRGEHERWLVRTRDTGFLTEPDIWERARGDTPWKFARDAARYPLETILRAARMVGDPKAVSAQAKMLRHPDRAVRYWAAVGLHAAGNRAASVRPALRAALTDDAVSVRIEAAAALAAQGETRAAIETIEKALETGRVEGVLHATRTLERMGGRARPALAAMKKTLARAQDGEAKGQHPCWMFVRFSAEAVLEELSRG